MDLNKLKESFDIVLPQLWIPKTPEWKKANVKRILVTKMENSNKYHPSGKNNPEVLPGEDLPEKQFTSCAVVGNGGSNLNANYGDAIDAHDAVFRFNDGPTVGFENKVGSKTTFRVINNAWTRAWLRRKPRGASEDALLLFGAGAAKSMDALYKKWGSEESIYFMAPEFAGAARGQYKKAYLRLCRPQSRLGQRPQLSANWRGRFILRYAYLRIRRFIRFRHRTRPIDSVPLPR